MSEEKQIEELANILWHKTLISPREMCDDVAEVLYNEGYRKQREGEWVTKGDFFKTYHCSLCNYSVDYPWQRTSYCPRCGAKMGGGAE